MQHREELAHAPRGRVRAWVRASRIRIRISRVRVGVRARGRDRDCRARVCRARDTYGGEGL